MMFFNIINNADDLNSNFDRYIRFFVGSFPEFATQLSDNRILCNLSKQLSFIKSEFDFTF